ncbi:hypothetical protein [Nocardia salmonicida]|uniref:hypothetical protein n=1 Tax=Nocardia salmonicida TaxID=53431 RepID=UPI0033D5606E
MSDRDDLAAVIRDDRGSAFTRGQVLHEGGDLLVLLDCSAWQSVEEPGPDDRTGVGFTEGFVISRPFSVGFAEEALARFLDEADDSLIP